MHPPFNKYVTKYVTKVAKRFLCLVVNHFPKTIKLHKISNKNIAKSNIANICFAFIILKIE